MEQAWAETLAATTLKNTLRLQVTKKLGGKFRCIRYLTSAEGLEHSRT